MKRLILPFVVLMAACCGPRYDAAEFEALRHDFAQPPRSARPMVWWHWMNGNITPEGIREDLLWMDRIGLGGFHVFDAALNTPQIVPERIEYMTPKWKEVFAGAIALADSLGLEAAVASSSGWSSTGGPWVPPEDAMKKLVWRMMPLPDGPYEGPLPDPFTVSSRFQNVPLPYEYNKHQEGPIPEWFYEDIGVYAVRMPESFRTLQELGATVCASGGHFTVEALTDGDLDNGDLLPPDPSGFGWVQYTFPEKQTFRAVTIVNRKARGGGHAVPATCLDSLQVSDDGLHWRTLCGITQGAAQQITERIPEASARYWRLKHPNARPRYHYGILQKPFDPATRVGEFVLHSHVPINHFEEKAGFAYPCDLTDYPSDGDAAPSEVIDISDCYRDGILRWTAPQGRWIIYRYGCSLTGKKNHPSAPEATGLEVDKLDKEAFARYLRHYLDLYRQAAGGLLGERGIRYLLIDSYESGAQTWTATLPAEFRARRGYDMMPWLPATAGVVIGSTEQTERFLWDLRRTIGELFAENYANATRICREDYGMDGVFIESHEHGRNAPADGISIKKTASYPMSAMWIQNRAGGSTTRRTEGLSDIRESASTAAIYGQQLVAAESLTTAGTGQQAYSYHPANLKGTADLEMWAGVNRFVIHESAHQPLDQGPGMGMSIYGQWFNRNDCWAQQAAPWVEYLSRSCALLQQGRRVADFLYYYGEDTNVTAQFSRSEPEIPAGFSYDFIGPEALMDEVYVRGGRLRTRSGMDYAALYVGGEGLRMSPEVCACLDRLRRHGARIVEPDPLPAALSLPAGFPRPALASLATGLAPDLAVPANGQPDGNNLCSEMKPVGPAVDDIFFVHRRTPSSEIYWLNNRAEADRTLTLSFRVSGRKPWLFHPETGQVRELGWSKAGDRTLIDLTFNAGEAFFVVFGEPVKAATHTVPQPEEISCETIPGPWNVTFQSGRGAPDSTRMTALVSLSDSPVPGIRYFSGTATYRTTFTLSPTGTDSHFQAAAQTDRYILDLGDVANIAEVRINGRDAGTAWRPPYRLDITELLSPGANELEIAVTNTWVNRLIGDEQPGAGPRITLVTWPFFTASDPLLPSGLLGPVTCRAFRP